MSTGWSNTKFRMGAIVWIPRGDGTTVPVSLDVIRSEFTYGLSTIPTCRLLIAVGRELRSGFASNIHYYANSMKMMMQLQVWMYAEEVANNIRPIPVDSWPDTSFVVFAGYVHRTSFDLSRSRGAMFVLEGLHGLAALTCSSCLTNRMTAQNAAALGTPAANGAGKTDRAALDALVTGPIRDLLRPMDLGVNGDANFLGSTSANKFVTEAALRDDVWSKVLAPWLFNLAISGPSQLADVPAGVVGANPVAATNFEALAALARFEPFYSGGFFPYWRKMPFAHALTGADEFRQGLSAHIGNETVRANSGTSFWDKIVAAYCADFEAMVVPMAESAMFVAAAPALAGRYATIWPHEYEGIGFTSYASRPLRAVCILRGRGKNTGAQGNQQGEAGRNNGPGGYFENPAMPHGMVLFQKAPGWIANTTPSSAWGNPSANPNGVVGRADAPGAGPSAASMGATATSILEGLSKNLWDRWAQAIYIDQLTADRSCYLNGKVRFDIAPGSTIRVVCIEERFAAQELAIQGLNPYYALYGRVNTVTTTIDSESMQAETRFQLDHVRDGGEANDLAFSSASHPLYTQVWLGGPLVNHPAFYRPIESEVAGGVVDQFGP